jgi:hypothetical protein
VDSGGGGGGGWATVDGDNVGWAAVARSFFSQCGFGLGTGDYTHLGIHVTYDGLDPTVISYLLFTSVRTSRRKLPLIYVGQVPTIVN